MHFAFFYFVIRDPRVDGEGFFRHEPGAYSQSFLLWVHGYIYIFFSFLPFIYLDDLGGLPELGGGCGNSRLLCTLTSVSDGHTTEPVSR